MAKKYLDYTGLSYFWTKIKDYVDAHTGGCLTIDAVYPVGSYYETSDTAFNPNTAFAGTTWELEAEGVVHISAGSTYVAGATGGSTTVTYTPVGSVDGHTLTAAESGVPAHGHGMAHQHAGNGSKYFVTSDAANASQARFNHASSGNRYVDANTTSGTFHHYTNTAGASKTVTDDNTASSAASAHSHGFTGTAGTIDVMQPYVVVKRWHRTA